jgi:hypothetical protein
MFLADVYLKHGEALEWDLFKYLGVDINDPRMTIRRLRNFFYRLPTNSETYSDIQNITREAREWSPELWMLANVYDAVAHLDWVTIAASSRHGSGKPPKPFPRPEMKKVVKSKKNIWPGKTIVDKGVKRG